MLGASAGVGVCVFTKIERHTEKMAVQKCLCAINKMILLEKLT